MSLETNGNRLSEARLYTENMSLAEAARRRAVAVAGPMAVEGLVTGSVIVPEVEVPAFEQSVEL